MLRMTYTPPDGSEPRQWAIENVDDHLTSVEAEEIEEAGGVQWRSFVGWARLISEGSFRAWRVLLWVLLRRDNPELDLNELHFPVSALDFDIADDETEPDPTVPEGEPGKDEPADSSTSGT